LASAYLFFRLVKRRLALHFYAAIFCTFIMRYTAAKDFNPSIIDWVVNFNKDEKNITNAIFEDTIPEGLELDLDSIEVYKLKVKLDGSVIEDGEFTGFTKSLAGNKLELGFGDIEDAYRVKYKTKINEGKSSYKNDAKLTGDSYTNGASATVTAKFSQPLAKKSKYDSATQTITWSIEYNYDLRDIKKELAWIKDTITTTNAEFAHEFVRESLKVYEVSINDNGNATRGNEVADIYSVDVTADGFELRFNQDIQSAYEIVYVTKPKERVRDSATVTNEVEMYGDRKASKSERINHVIFWKSADNKQINYNEKTITWRLYLNYDKQKMNNVVVTDSYANQRLELIENSLKITVPGTNKVPEYTLEPDQNYREGFKITFDNEIEDHYVIEYKTRFDPNYFNSHDITNHGKVEWLEGTTSYSKEDSRTVSSDRYTKKNGEKTGEYDATNKRITWTIDVNYNLRTITNPVLTDFYQGDQKIDKGSLKVYNLILKGGADQVDVGTEVPAGNYEVEWDVTNSEGDKGFRVKFVNGLQQIDTAYRITYETSLEEREVLTEYSNEATLSGDEGSDLFKDFYTVKPKHGGEYVFKEGIQGSGADSETAFWTVYLNRNQSWIAAGTTLKDNLSDNQMLIPDSFVL